MAGRDKKKASESKEETKGVRTRRSSAPSVKAIESIAHAAAWTDVLSRLDAMGTSSASGSTSSGTSPSSLPPASAAASLSSLSLSSSPPPPPSAVVPVLPVTTTGDARVGALEHRVAEMVQLMKATAVLRQIPTSQTKLATPQVPRTATGFNPLAASFEVLGRPRFSSVPGRGASGESETIDEEDRDFEDMEDELVDPAHEKKASRTVAVARGGSLLTAMTVPPGTEVRERIAAEVVTSVLKQAGSFIFWIKCVEWRSGRNRHEASVLGQTLDALLFEGLEPDQSAAMEILVRRLVGVHEVDQGRDWSVAKALAWEGPGSILPRSALRSALREAAIEAKLQTKPKATGRGAGGLDHVNPSRGGRGGRGGRGRGARGWHNKNERGGTLQASSSAGPAAQK